MVHRVVRFGQVVGGDAGERKLLEMGRPAYVLDGDKMSGAASTPIWGSRWRTVRRTCAGWRTSPTLFGRFGQIVLVPAISPLEEHRELARKVHTDQGFDFYEVFMDTPLADCEARDPKGLYAKARAGNHPFHRDRQPVPAAEESRRR